MAILFVPVVLSVCRYPCCVLIRVEVFSRCLIDRSCAKCLPPDRGTGMYKKVFADVCGPPPPRPRVLDWACSRSWPIIIH